jgi:outer membrane receptor protein involved in Fe transport
LENITNRRYRTYSSGISAPGRNVLLRLDVRI